MIPQENENKTLDINWTSQELQEWVKAGLILPELLDHSRVLELTCYIKENMELLHNHYRRNAEEDRFQITVPPQNEWHKAPDLQVIDRQTGEVVSVLEMAGNFDLCEGICLRIKAKELPEWEKETSDARKLNKEERETFIATIDKIGKDKPLSRKEIVKIIEEIRKPNKTFRQSRELIDNKLDRDNENQQLTFFDLLDNKEKKINELPAEKPIIKGLELDQSEDRIVHTLTLLLNKNSENRNQKSSNYYMGNYEKGIVSINEIEMETARIIISPHELYSTYYGKENYGSDQIGFVLNKLNELSKKTYLTTWNFPVKTNKKGEIKYNKFRTYCPLFQIAILNKDLSESESQEIDNNKSLIEGKNCLFLFKFQPQFTNNIRQRYVEFPQNIYPRIAEAVESKRIPQCINLMRDFLFREKQQKRSEIFRDKETMINILKLDKFWKENRKKKVKEMIEKSFVVFKKIGLIKDWEETRGAIGQDQYKIVINLDFK